VAVNVTIQNNGAALGIGSSSVSCMLNVTVVQVPLPPVLANTAFFVPELSPVGTLVGNVGATDPANFTVSNYSWSTVDTPNAFSIDPQSGNVTLTSVIDTLVLLKSTWSVR
jgi:hypothetical protein